MLYFFVVLVEYVYTYINIKETYSFDTKLGWII